MRRLLIAGFVLVASIGLYAPSASAALCAAGDKAQVLWKGTWYPATAIKSNGAQCYIHYDGYGSNWDEWVGADRIKVTSSSGAAPAAVTASFKEGDPVSVLWKGTWYPASVLKVLGGGRYRIHYDGYDASWDENVGPSRIKGR